MDVSILAAEPQLSEHLMMTKSLTPTRAVPRRILNRRRCGLAAAVALAIAANGSNPAAVSAAERKDTALDMMVTVVRTKNMCFEDALQVTGVVTPRNEILVRPASDGMISQVLVEAGETVSSGQVLARLAPPEGQTGSGASVQAPSAGLVSSKTAVVGMPTSSRGEPLFRIAANEEMELLAETPIKNLTRIAPNQSAKIEIIGVGELNGKVRQLATAINQTTQLGQIRLFIGRDSRVRVGAFGRATIEIARRCGPSIPFSAVLYGPGGAIVQTVRDGRVETRRVTVGLLNAGQAEIREGLSEGDMVIARAGAFVRDGDRVRTVAAPDQSPRR
jgi:HlyD family secretion protein